MTQPPPPREFCLIKQLGKGSFSEVWLAQHVAFGKAVSVKIIRKNDVNKSDAILRMQREIEIHLKAQHRFISSLFWITEDLHHIFLIMEYIPNGTLMDRVKDNQIKKDNNVSNHTDTSNHDGNNFVNSPVISHKHGNGKLSELEALHYFAQILKAVNYLHNVLNVVHRDLKLENVLIDQYNNVRLIDFGFSAFESSQQAMNETCGSPRYAAPEIYLEQPCTKAIDMWALGVILYFLVTGTYPFDAKCTDDLAEKVIESTPTYSVSMSSHLRSLLQKLLTKDPKKRITVEQALNHPWILNKYASEKNNNEVKNDKENDEADSPIFSWNDSLLVKINKREKATQNINGKVNHSSVRFGFSAPTKKNNDDQTTKMTATERLLASGKFRLNQKKNNNIQTSP
ncbi:AGC family protein kinase [Tritrichomonas foetus]|uniref:AGC family protein kinase n=1 Tax=Tritrichomonas foetus TaxID=1144522 RepID=A0A1J4KNN8_9EUKA|nr:AGC family protein kinase [Tritrichomonas foetus]|eukprot:OHT12528.1 AGC family protein kinase [Tritrichomonas foetus]